MYTNTPKFSILMKSVQKFGEENPLPTFTLDAFDISFPEMKYSCAAGRMTVLIARHTVVAMCVKIDRQIDR